MPEPAFPPAVSTRLVSLDALRGFDMFWILGMEEVGAAIGKASDAPWATLVATQLDHAAWAGFHFLDLIFPLFVFIAGASTVFSMEKSLATRGRAATLRKLLFRAVVLYVLGLLCYGGISKGVDHIRWFGVLQRIAITSFAAGLAYVFLSHKARFGLCVGLLIAYWGLMTFVPVPGIGAGDFAEARNLANWIDAHYLGGFKWDPHDPAGLVSGTHDPEGLLSTLPAIASALLGVFAGEWLRQTETRPARKVIGLLCAGVVLVAAGWLWHLQFPVIKKLWTSSFVLVAGGYSCLLLGASYWLIDVCGLRKWAAPFVWIGMNPITLYLSHYVVDYEKAAEWIGGGPVAAAFGAWGDVWLATLVTVFGLLLAWFLHSRKLFLRV